MQVVLAHLYAGHERDGWAFFDRHFPKEMQTEQKPMIQKRLGEDPFLQETAAMLRAIRPKPEQRSFFYRAVPPQMVAPVQAYLSSGQWLSS